MNMAVIDPALVALEITAESSDELILETLPEEALRLIAMRIPSQLCFALCSRLCLDACPRPLRSSRKAACYGSLQLFEWAVACGCKPPRRMSPIVERLDLDLDRLTAPYRAGQANVRQLANGAIIPLAGARAHAGSVRLARDAEGKRLARPRALSADELERVVYFRPLLWTGEIALAAVGHQMWHVLFASEPSVSTPFTLSRLLDVIAYFVGYFKPRQRAADWRHVSSSVWQGVFEPDGATMDVWLFQHAPVLERRASSLMPRVVRGSMGGRGGGAEVKLEPPRRYREEARVCMDDEDEDLRFLKVHRRGASGVSGPVEDARCAAAEAGGVWDLDGRNAHGFLLLFSSARSRGDMLASILAHFEI